MGARHALRQSGAVLGAFWASGWVLNLAWASVVVAVAIMALSLGSLMRSQSDLRAATDQLRLDIDRLEAELNDVRDRVAAHLVPTPPPRDDDA